jgi:hypothetical protein
VNLPGYVRYVENFLRRCRLSLENFVQWFFRALNRRAHLGIAFQKIRGETAEHVDQLSSALKKLVLPLSICYLCLGFFLGNNVIDSLVFSILIFVYSHFLPDLLSPFRIRNKKEKDEDRPWFKKYALLLLAPLFIFLLWGDGIPLLRTTEHFHNVRSLGIYSLFLLLLGLIFYGNLPLSLGRILEVFSLTIFGSIGYLTHLKVDKIL